jgi:hypothetical protein
MIVSKENLHLVENPTDRREIRNYMRFLRLWPKHKLTMLQRISWQRYLNLTPQEALALSKPVV